jgi:hypothetical protein
MIYDNLLVSNPRYLTSFYHFLDFYIREAINGNKNSCVQLWIQTCSLQLATWMLWIGAMAIFFNLWNFLTNTICLVILEPELFTTTNCVQQGSMEEDKKRRMGKK